MSQYRLKSQIKFIAEIDKLKSVLRKTSPIGQNRKENSAEHTWQVIVTAMTLAEHSNQEINLGKVIKMLAIHDIVEIDVGDTFHYDKELEENLYEKELASAERIFGLLPEDQKLEYLTIWKEFEEQVTPESKFAHAVDRLMAFILNYYNQGGTWLEFNLKLEQVLAKNSHIRDGSAAIWTYVESLLEKAIQKKYIVHTEKQ